MFNIRLTKLSHQIFINHKKRKFIESQRHLTKSWTSKRVILMNHHIKSLLYVLFCLALRDSLFVWTSSKPTYLNYFCLCTSLVRMGYLNAYMQVLCFHANCKTYDKTQSETPVSTKLHIFSSKIFCV